MLAPGLRFQLGMPNGDLLKQWGGLEGMMEGQERGVLVWWETPCLRQKYLMRAMPSFV